MKNIEKKRAESLPGKIALQRLFKEHEKKNDQLQPVNSLKEFKAAKKEDIADKVERQRNQRKKPKKKPTGAEGKNPQTVTSKKPPKWN